jgi:hypothetical protein
MVDVSLERRMTSFVNELTTTPPPGRGVSVMRR